MEEKEDLCNTFNKKKEDGSRMGTGLTEKDEVLVKWKRYIHPP